MFSFFKRFKGSKESENAPDESQIAPEGLIDEPAAAAPAEPPVPAKAGPAASASVPASIVSPPAASPEPQPQPDFEESTLETVEIVWLISGEIRKEFDVEGRTPSRARIQPLLGSVLLCKLRERGTNIFGAGVYEMNLD